MEDRFPIMEVMRATPEIPDTCQWALFLRNHDELTLEMVTDEDRDYMYRVYAADPQARINLGIRRRLAPLLGNHRRKIELMTALLFSLPGTPVIYYGDEIGMGDNIYLGDRNGVRTPMQWSPDRNAGFSRANPQRLYLPLVIDPEYHFESLNVESQDNNTQSLLWWIKRLIALRRGHPAFGRGTIELLTPENRKVLAFLRQLDGETILVLVNLSRFTQYVELDLHGLPGRIPVELFGRTRFPPIGDAPYFFTLGPHTFYWFTLEASPTTGADHERERDIPELRVHGSWLDAIGPEAPDRVLSAIEAYLGTCRWFGGKARTLSKLSIVDRIEASPTEAKSCFTLVRAEYVEGEPETYILPLAFWPESEPDPTDVAPGHVVARVTVNGEAGEATPGVLYESVADEELAEALLRMVAGRERVAGVAGSIVGVPAEGLAAVWSADQPVPEPSLVGAEQSNTSLRFGQKLILKIYRKVDGGVNPDLEIGRFLTEQTDFVNTPPVVGSLVYRPESGPEATLGILQRFVPNEGDAWQYTIDALRSYWERCLALPHGERKAVPPDASLMARAEQSPDEDARGLIGPYLNAADELGRVTAELHLALASSREDPAFAPEPHPPHFSRSLFQSVGSQIRDCMELLVKRAGTIPAPDRELVDALVSREADLHGVLRELTTADISARRIRTHGDFHLGQVLFTGRDFVVIDFEGEPARSISQRRLKRSPLRDVAGMLRSFHYASVFGLQLGGVIRPEDVTTLEPWRRLWHDWVTAAYLQTYQSIVGNADFLPGSREGREALLRAFLLEKAIYELRYELNNRPSWVRVPVDGLLEILGPADG